MSSPLSSRHFRNQLSILRQQYINFRILAQESWPGIQIQELEGAKGYSGDELRLLVRDKDFVAEVGLMGHGLQMWLQTAWFLSRVKSVASVVLDEPDVYMHPDIQRRLIRLVRDRFPQVIIATHSVEIVADLDPSEILIIDRRRKRSLFADTLPAVQRLIERIGGVHNVHLARLWDSGRFILVEGKDLSYLKTIHDKLYPDSPLPLDDIPNSSIGGWDGWRYAIGQSMFAKNAIGQAVRVYCILDSDYHSPEEIKERQVEAINRCVDLHIWSRKEIENYFLIPTVIARIVCNRITRQNVFKVSKDIEGKIAEIVASLENDVFDGIATRFRDRNPRGNVTEANRSAREVLDGVFEDPMRALEKVSGKEVLKRLSGWIHEKWGRGLSIRDVLREIKANEVPEEVKNIIDLIENSQPFPQNDV